MKKARRITRDKKLVIFRSNLHIYGQVINLQNGEVIAQASDLKIEKNGRRPVEIASEVGKILAEKSIEKGVKQIYFDRKGYKYHGRVKALVEAMRSKGMEF